MVREFVERRGSSRVAASHVGAFTSMRLVVHRQMRFGRDPESIAPRRTINEIQRTWSYLEPLFIHSDKRELPVDAERFAGIDVEIKDILTTSVTQR